MYAVGEIDILLSSCPNLKILTGNWVSIYQTDNFRNLKNLHTLKLTDSKIGSSIFPALFDNQISLRVLHYIPFMSDVLNPYCLLGLLHSPYSSSLEELSIRYNGDVHKSWSISELVKFYTNLDAPKLENLTSLSILKVSFMEDTFISFLLDYCPNLRYNLKVGILVT
jgi:hypothetical protein